MLNYLIITLLGMAVGSFLTMASYRLYVEGNIKDLLINRSACANCHQNLKIINLIPIFSWILQMGKCSFCKTKISCRYIIIEIITTISFYLIFVYYGKKFDFGLAIILMLFCALFLMVITDLENYFIADINQLFLFIIIILFHFYFTLKLVDAEYSISYYFLSSLIYLIVIVILQKSFKYIKKYDGIGIDDVKLFPLIGLLIGVYELGLFMLLSGLIGMIYGYAWLKIKKEKIFPFAPALIIALFIILLKNNLILI